MPAVGDHVESAVKVGSAPVNLLCLMNASTGAGVEDSHLEII